MSIKRKRLLLSFLVVNALTLILGVLGWEVFSNFIIIRNVKDYQTFLLSVCILLMGLILFVYTIDSDKEVKMLLADDVKFISTHLLILFILTLFSIIKIARTGELPNTVFVGIEVVLLGESLIYMMTFCIAELYVEFKDKLKSKLTVSQK